MAEGTLRVEEFGRNILEFLQVSERIKDSWEMQYVENQSSHQPRRSFLVKRNVVRVIPSAAGVRDAGHRPRPENETSRTVGGEVNLEKEEADEDVTLSMSPDGPAASLICRFDYHIVYHPSYGVPALYFTACHGDGKLLSLDEVWQSVPSHYQNRLQTERWTFITQQEHPILGRPFFLLHPCHTADLMRAVMTRNDSKTTTTRTSYRNYLVTWLSSVGPVVGLPLPLDYAPLCDER